MIDLILWLRSFFATLQWHGDNVLQTLTWHRLSFSIFTVWHRLFSLVLLFPRLRIEALLPSTVQGKCIYTFLKLRTRKFNFRSYVLNPVKINISFCHSRGQFIGLLCHIVESNGPIYRPSMPQSSNRAGRFIGHPCQLDKIFGPIYRPTAAKWLSNISDLAMI